MSRVRLRIVYAGQVQGVGFRYTVKSLAPGYEVTGGVRNLPDGRVEMIAEGARDELDALAQAVMDSGLGPLIRDVETHWEDARGGMRGFEILP